MKLVIAIVRLHHHHTCSIYVSTCVNHFSSLFIIFNHVSQFFCFPEALNSLNLQKNITELHSSLSKNITVWMTSSGVPKRLKGTDSCEKRREMRRDMGKQIWKTLEKWWTHKTLINNNNHQQSPKRVASTWKCWKDLFPIYSLFLHLFRLLGQTWANTF